MQQNPNKTSVLPTLCANRHHCHCSIGPYLAYLCSTTQIKIVEFLPSTTNIKSTQSITIPLEPVKAISLNIYKGIPYLAIAMIPRILVFKIFPVQQVYQDVANLDTNIVNFQNGFVAVQRVEEGFIFLTKKGGLHIYMLNTQGKSCVILNQDTYCSLAVSYPHVYVGTQVGKLKHFKIKGTSEVEQGEIYDTNSKFPILNIHVYIQNNKLELLCGTCEGQLHILDQGLQAFSILSAHYAAISLMFICNGDLLTVGEQGVIKKFKLLGGRKLKLMESKDVQKLVSLLFSIEDKPYMSYYETPEIIEL